ncbi:MAG: hypothetical protein M1834_003323 [Cirrosporium novae-zelandiae]|nr:MAG: hypothetical protein M1834_003323 [Cirrosporium novae-zelandiae]
MPTMLCCLARRPDSPNLRSNSVDHTNSQASARRSRGIESEDSEPINDSSSDAQALREIFRNSIGTIEGSGQKDGVVQKGTPCSDRNRSNSRLSAVANDIRKRISRDSVFSRNSKRLNHVQSTDGLDEDARSKYQQTSPLPEDLLEDRRASQGGYDSDAATIATPKASREPSAGTQFLNQIIHGTNPTRPTSMQIMTPMTPRKIPMTQQNNSEEAENRAGYNRAGDSLDLCSTPPPQPTRDHSTPRSLGTLPAAPDLSPLRLPSIDNPSLLQEWRLSFSCLEGKSPVKSSNKRNSIHPASVVFSRKSLAGNDGAISERATDEIMPAADIVQLNEIPRSTSNASLAEKSIHLYNMRISQNLALTQPAGMSGSDSSTISKHRRGQSSTSSARFSVNPYHIQHLQRNSSFKFSFSSAQDFQPQELIPADNASSVYPSQGGSPAPTPKSSVPQLRARPSYPAQIDGPKSFCSGRSPTDDISTSLDTRDNFLYSPTESSWLRGRTNDSTSFLSSTDSYRNRELLAAERRFAQKPRAVTLPKMSKFRENFDSNLKIDAQEPSNSPHSKKSNRRSMSSSAESISWKNSKKRTGYGYSFVGDLEDTSITWEKALRHHIDQQAKLSKMHSTHPTANVGWGSTIPISKYNARHPGKLSKSTHSLKVARSRTSIAEVSKSSAAIFSIGLSREPRSPSALSTPSWARFPLHRKAERESGITPTDEVVTCDFATLSGVVNDPRAEDPEASSQRVRAKALKKKSRSMTFGKKIMKRLTTIYRTKSMEFRIPNVGHRSSIATGGRLDHPELQVLPPSHPLVPQVESEKFRCLINDALQRSTPIEDEGIPLSGNRIYRPLPSPNILSRHLGAESTSQDLSEGGHSSERSQESGSFLQSTPKYKLSRQFDHKPSLQDIDEGGRSADNGSSSFLHSTPKYKLSRLFDKKSTPLSTDSEEGSSIERSPDAKVWSRLYEDCVSLPKEFDQASRRSGTKEDPPLIPMMLGSSHLKRPKGMPSSEELRRSTINFQHELEATELVSKEELFNKIGDPERK